MASAARVTGCHVPQLLAHRAVLVLSFATTVDEVRHSCGWRSFPVTMFYVLSFVLFLVFLFQVCFVFSHSGLFFDFFAEGIRI